MRLSGALAAIVLTWCGAALAENAPNVVPLVLKTPGGGFNRLVVSVTVCAPGAERCATIDDVMVDTGATGLRLEAFALPAGFALPAHTGPDGAPLAECLRYVHDSAWGPLARADIRIGGLTAADVPVQIIGESLPHPDACPPSGANPTSNGTLGLGPWLTDCAGACEQLSWPQYFTCSWERCAPLMGPLPERYRVPNPAALFAGHDNGLVFDLPDVAPEGARSVTGSLTFGVGEQSLADTAVVELTPAGRFTTVFAGRAYPESLLDSGSPAHVVATDALPRCPSLGWAYCATPERSERATVIGADGAKSQATFRLGDAEERLAHGMGASAAMVETAMSGSPAFVWGAPFFAGRHVALVFEGRTVGARTGPFFGFRTAPP